MLYDIVVIGGGTGGYVSAIKAAQMGAKVCLIEKDSIGGTCLNRGCIPTKTLLKCSQIYNIVKDGQDYGIEGIDPYKISVNIDKIIDKKNMIVKDLKYGIECLLAENKVDYLNGKAEVLNKTNVIVGNNKVQTKNLIIATGAEPAIIPIDGLKDGMKSGFVITSNEALDLRKLPKKLTIIGGGVIGVELATFFNNIGVNVSIIEMQKEIIPTVDSEISVSLKKYLISKGIDIYVEAKAKSIRENSIKIEYQNLEKTIDADLVILAVGRVPRTEGLENLSIKMEKKAILTNNKMETNIPGVYAIGDVTGKFQLAHVASKEGCVAVENALGKKSNMNYNVIPQCIYTSPQIASVGMTEAAAVEKGYNIKVGKFPMYANSKASIEGQKEGFAKIICDSKYGEVLGIHLFGENATEIILSGVISLNMEASIEDIANAISPHPSVSETITESAQAAIFKAIHI
jgi:dihydrolipoamide dehydrogenase